MTGRKQEAAAPPESGALLDVVALDRTGVLVTSEGALVRIVEVTPRNPRPMGDDERRRVSDGFAAMAGRLCAGQTLQFYIEASPVLLSRILEDKRAAIEPVLKGQPWQRADAMRSLAGAHEQSLTTHAGERAAVRFRAYTIVPYLPDPPAVKVNWETLRARSGRRLPRTTLTRGLEDHARVMHESMVHTDNIVSDLEALDLATHLLDGTEVQELLFRRFSPSSVGTGYMPRLEVVGSLDEVADSERAAEAAHRLREQIAASPVDFDDSRFVGVEQDLERVLYVSRVTDITEFGWLMSAMEIDRPFALSVFVHALDRASERNRIRRQRRRLHGVNAGVEKSGRVADIEMTAQEEEAGELLEELRGSNRASVYRMSTYQTIRESPSRQPDGRMALNELQLINASEKAVAAIRDAVDGDAKFGGFMQRALWLSTLPLGRDVARRTKKYVSRNVGDTIPLVGPSCGSPGGIPFFFAEGVRTLENLDPWDPMINNGLCLINGKQGTGKTVIGITMAARLLPYGVNITVLDNSENQWEMLTRLVPGAAHLSIGTANSDATINPWDVPDLQRVSPEKIAFLRDMHELMIGERRAGERSAITEEERGLLSLAIRGAYARCARKGREPSERYLVEELERLERVDREAAGAVTHRATVLQSLASRLGPYVLDGEDAYLADRPTTVPDDVPLIVFNLRTARAQRVPAMFAALEHTERKLERRRAERLGATSTAYFPGDALFSDETWALMQHRSTGEFYNSLSRRSRQLGLFNCGITQHFSDLDNEHGRAMLRSAYRKIFLEQAEEELRHLQDDLRLSDNEVRRISRLSTSRGRHAMAYWINGPRGRAVVRLLLGGLEYWMSTSEPTIDVPLRNAALARYPEDPWMALRELAEGGTVR